MVLKSFGGTNLEEFSKGAERACGCIEYEGLGKDKATGWMGNEVEGILYTDADGRHLTRADFIKEHGNDPLTQKHIQERIKNAGLFAVALKAPIE